MSIPTDINDNRRHIHIVRKGGRHIRSVAKIWIERNGEKYVEIASSELTAKENEYLVETIKKNWAFLNDQITKSFNGEKTVIKKLD